MFDIDWQGNRSLTATAHEDVVSDVSFCRPARDALETRLHNRAQDSEEEITKRLAKANDEIKHYKEFQYIIVNYDFEDSVERVPGHHQRAPETHACAASTISSPAEARQVIITS